MSTYIPVELQRQIRHRFADCCAYCLTAEALTATTFTLCILYRVRQEGKQFWKMSV